MKQVYYCGRCMKGYPTERQALNCCYKWKVKVGAIKPKPKKKKGK